jgi:hypothetical protein
MGRWHDGKSGLAHSEGVREGHWCRKISAARSASHLCSAMPCFGRGVGAGPIPFGARLRFKPPNDALGASSGCDRQSMIASASSPFLELGVTVMEKWLTSDPEHVSTSHTPRTSRVGLTDLRNLPSLHANCLRSHQSVWFRHREDRVYEVRRGCEITLGIELRFPCLLQYEPLQECEQHA